MPFWREYDPAKTETKNPWDSDPIVGQNVIKNPWDDDPIVGQEATVEEPGYLSQLGDRVAARAQQAIGGGLSATARVLQGEDTGSSFDQFMGKTADIGEGIAESGSINLAEAGDYGFERPDSIMAEPGKALKYYGTQALESFAGDMLPSMAMGFAMRSLGTVAVMAGGLGTMGAKVFGEEYANVFQETQDHDKAMEAGAVRSFAETLPETIPFGLAMKIGGKAVAKIAASRMALWTGTALTEGGSEVVTELMNGMYDEYGLGKIITKEEWAQRFKDAFVVGVGLGGMMGAPAAMSSRRTEEAPPAVPPVSDPNAEEQLPVLDPESGQPLASVAPQTPSEKPFYSALVNTVDQAQGMPKKGTWQAFKGWLDGKQGKPDGFKQEERDWMGVDEWLSEHKGPVTREEFQEFVKANQVEIKEVTKGDPVLDEGLAKFSEYQLPGGENYREMLLMLPMNEEVGYDVIGKNGEVLLRQLYDRATADKMARQHGGTVQETKISKPGVGDENYTGGHYDEANVLAHIRFNERTDADGKRVLFIEEIQSDWHQAGRKAGYADGKSERLRYAQSTDGKVPNAPFKSSMTKTGGGWGGLAMKRMLRYAAENGFDSVAWTTGEQQAERYDLSKQVQEVHLLKNRNDTWDVSVRKLDGQLEDVKTKATNEELAGIVGKDLAEKAVDGQGEKSGDWQIFRGLDLKVGGEGMKGFYDEMLVNNTNKFVKKWGGRVGQTKIDAPPYAGGVSGEMVMEQIGIPPSQQSAYWANLDQQTRNGLIGLYRENKRPANPAVHSLDITPSMKDAALQGLPMFSKAQTSQQGKLTLDQLSQAVSEALAPEHAALVNTVQSAKDIPNSQNMQKIGAYEGFYDPQTGQVYLIADNISSEGRAKWVAWHELLHRGIRVKYGKLLSDALIVASRNGTVKKLADAIMKDRGMPEGKRGLAVEEALAELNAAIRTGNITRLAERYQVNIPESLQAGWRNAVKRFMQTLRNIMSKVLGIPMDEVSDAEIWSMVRGTDVATGEISAAKGEVLASRAARTDLAQVSWESRPGRTTNYMPEAFSAPYSVLTDFHKAISNALLNEEGKNNIAAALGIRAPVNFEAPGYFEGLVSPGTQAQVKAPEELINAYAAAHGILLRQDAVGWHKPVWTAAKKKSNGVEISIGRPFSEGETSKLAAIMSDLSGHTEYSPIASPTGVRLINWDYVGFDNLRFQKMVNSALAQIQFDNNEQYMQELFAATTGYVSNNWKENTNGEGYYTDGLKGQPDLQRRVRDIVAQIKPRVEAVNQEFADKYGWTTGETGLAESPVRPGGSGAEGVLASVRENTLQGLVLGQKQAGTSPIKGVHYGNTPANTLNADKYGTGIKGKERSRVDGSPDPRIKRRVYFYIPKAATKSLVYPEDGTGSHVSTQTFGNVLNVLTDTKGLIAVGNAGKKIYAAEQAAKNGWPHPDSAFESAVIEAGYDGYAVPQSGMMVILNHDVPVNYQGTAAELESHGVKYDRRLDLAKTTITDRSDVLEVLGYGNHRIQMPDAKMEKGYSEHPDLSDADFNKLGDWLNDPVAVFDDPSIKGAGNLLFVGPEAVNGFPVRIIVAPKTSPQGVKSHVLVTAYPDPHMNIGSFLNDPRGLLRYKNSAKVQTDNSWIQWPRVEPNNSRNVKTQKDLAAVRPKEVLASVAPQTDTKTLTKLPMDSESRMARAEVMGFDTSTIWYHGTTADINAFETGRVSINTILGSQIPTKRSAIFLSSNKDYSDAFVPNSKTMALYVAANNTLDLDSYQGKETVLDFVDHLFAKNMREEALAVKSGHLESWQLLDGVLGEEFVSYLTANQLADSVSFIEDTANPVYGEEHIEGETLAVFDPKNIRSINATFDPANEASADILASTAPKYSDPVLQSASDRIGYHETLWAKLKRLFSQNWHDQIQQGMFDKFYGILKATKDMGGDVAKNLKGYTSARLSTSIQDRLAVILKHSRIKWENGVLAPIEGTDGFLKILEPVADRIDDFGRYLIGKRSREIEASGKKTGFTTAQIDKLIGLGQTNPDFEAVRLKYMDFNKSILDVAMEAGLIDGKTRLIWESDNYVPFYRIMEEGTVGPRTKRSLAGQQFGKGLKGSEKHIGDPIENIMMNWAHLIDASVKNKALLQIITDLEGSALMEKLPHKMRKRVTGAEPTRRKVEYELEKAGIEKGVGDMLSSAPTLSGLIKIWSIEAPTGPDIIRVMRNGKAEYYKVHDPLLLRSLSSVNEKAWGKEMEFFRIPKRILTSMVTADPAFMARNFIRDSLSSFVLGRDRMTPVVTGLKGVVKAYKEDWDMVRFMAAGGTFSTGGYLNASDPGAMKRFVMSEAHYKNFNKTLLNSPKRLWDFWQHLGSSAENGNRVAIGMAALKGGKDMAGAAYEMKDIMDFSMRGDYAVIQFLAETVPFFSARLQGMQRLGRGVAEHPGAFALKGGLITMAAIALYMSNRDDDRYKELEEWDKDTYFHFWVGDYHYRLPKPFEVGVLFGTIPERMAEMMIDEDSGTKEFLKRLSWNFTQTLSMNPIPQVAKPAYEAWANRSSFTDRPIIGTRLAKLSAEAQYEPWTSATMRELGRAWEVSPKHAEALARGYFGTIGSYVLSAADVITRQLYDYPNPPTMKLEETPVISAFYRGTGTPMNTKYTTEFYDFATEVDGLYSAINNYRTQGNRERATELFDENRDKLRWRGLLNARQANLAQINKQIRAIHYHKTMAADEKARRINILRARKNKITQQAVEKVGPAF